LSGSSVRLERIDYGRLVDVYAYRRVDPARRDRRDSQNRVPALVAKNVVIDPTLQSDRLFDPVGDENLSANYRFMPFDLGVGHDELLILWDDTAPGEKERFDAALQSAQASLIEVPASFRNQNTAVSPIPVVPRDAALKLTFDRDLRLNDSFFVANPSAVQVLEFRGDPRALPAPLAFRPVRSRILAAGNALVIDTSLIGGEQRGAFSTGLPASTDSVTANIRIALPTGGDAADGFRVEPDDVPQLNDVDANGDPAVIRDFRSGNASDGPAGALSDGQAPSIVLRARMGITAVTPDIPGDASRGGVLTLNKRGLHVAIRGRVPFVDGGIDSSIGLPGGPPTVPGIEALRSGDVIFQDVTTPSGEVVRVRAEVIQNEDVANVTGQPGFPALGLTTNSTDGGEADVARVRVASLTGGRDSSGNPVAFEASSQALGAECIVQVHYYHNVPYSSGQAAISDSDPERMATFVTFDPIPPTVGPGGEAVVRGTLIDPTASMSLGFSEPMDLTVVQNYDNFLLSTDALRAIPNQVTAAQLLQEPKPCALSMLATRFVDENGDGTSLRLVPPLGLFHQGPAGGQPGQAERYWFHVLSGVGGPTDLAGNPVDLYDRRLNQDRTFSVGFTLDPDAEDNLVASRVFRFAAIDEDGTPPGSEDYFGQAQIDTKRGEIGGAPVQRFSQIADRLNMSGLAMGGNRFTRWDRGECWDQGNASAPMRPPQNIAPAQSGVPFWGSLYMCPDSFATQPAAGVPLALASINPNGPVNFGGILEPLNPRGSRLQMTYREDDFTLDYTSAHHMNLDVEQVHWAPWNNQPVQFDVFDRVTIEAAHSDWRPDLLFFGLCPNGSSPPCQPTGNPQMVPAISCNLDCASMQSGLTTTFANNYLQGTQPQTVVKDREYRINPNSAFKDPITGTVFVPYAKFEQTYTWRDSRLVSWDTAANRAIGLGGAKQPDGTPPNQDRTAHVSSPWLPEEFPDGYPGQSTSFGNTWVSSEADFRGDRVRDHDPIAMPLLLDFMVYADDPANGVASGSNALHMGYVGPCWTGTQGPFGYYPGVAAPYGLHTGLALCGNQFWPNLRVHTSGGINGSTGREEFVLDPANQTVATGGWILDVGVGDPTFGLARVPGGDDHLLWAKADFVRKVSMVTYGYFDTLLPNQHDLDASRFNTKWPGLSNKRGFPDFDSLATERGVTYAPVDLVVVTDPPLNTVPAGTSVQIDLRGAETFERSDQIYDKAVLDTHDGRGNLLNPNYACEAYRYAMPNSGPTKNVPRVTASGLTPYVGDDEIDQLRDQVGLLPRFLNMRIVFENDTASNPPISPKLRSLSISYRMTER
jgi:hypothetical protein